MILNFNIRSIPKILQYLTDNIIYNNSLYLDIVGLTEIRLNPSLSPMYSMPGYNTYVIARNVYGGGVAIYANSRLDTTLAQEFTISHEHLETVCIESASLSRKCVFMCVYRPPSGSFKELYESMNNILNLIYTKKYSDIYIYIR